MSEEEPTESNQYGEWTTLEGLREGALFETRNGVRAVKSQYHYTSNGASQCVLLTCGGYAHFPERGKTEVREIILGAVQSEDDIRNEQIAFLRANIAHLEHLRAKCSRGNIVGKMSLENRRQDFIRQLTELGVDMVKEP